MSRPPAFDNSRLGKRPLPAHNRRPGVAKGKREAAWRRLRRRWVLWLRERLEGS